MSSGLVSKDKALLAVESSCNLTNALCNISRLQEIEITDNFDRGYEQALKQVLAEARVRCHRGNKNCELCKKNDLTCNTYEVVARVKDLHDLGF